MLLIANLHDIRCTSLSGSTSRLPSITTKQTMAMDFIYALETVCWIDVGDTAATTQLKCTSIPDLKVLGDVRTINISLSLHREYIVPVYMCGGTRDWIGPQTEAGSVPKPYHSVSAFDLVAHIVF